MPIDISPVPLDEVLPLRDLYRREMNCQIIHDSLPGRGFGDLFLIRSDGRVAGYGFVMGYRGEPKDMIREFFILPAYRSAALPIFRQLIAVSHATRIMAQTNDVLLTLLLYDSNRNRQRHDPLPRRPDNCECREGRCRSAGVHKPKRLAAPFSVPRQITYNCSASFDYAFRPSLSRCPGRGT